MPSNTSPQHQKPRRTESSECEGGQDYNLLDESSSADLICQLAGEYCFVMHSREASMRSQSSMLLCKAVPNTSITLKPTNTGTAVAAAKAAAAAAVLFQEDNWKEEEVFEPYESAHTNLTAFRAKQNCATGEMEIEGESEWLEHDATAMQDPVGREAVCIRASPFLPRQQSVMDALDRLRSKSQEGRGLKASEDENTKGMQEMMGLHKWKKLRAQQIAQLREEERVHEDAIVSGIEDISYR